MNIFNQMCSPIRTTFNNTAREDNSDAIVLSYGGTYSYIYILLRVWGSVTNNNGFWIGWLDLLALRLQLQSIITAHNQWLSKTRSIPYWTTSDFCMIDLVLIYESVTASASLVRWFTLHNWTLKSVTTEPRFPCDWAMNAWWMPLFLSARLLLLSPVSVENVGCLFVSVETLWFSILYSFHLRTHRNVCCLSSLKRASRAVC
jgi:hypothetical protein